MIVCLIGGLGLAAGLGVFNSSRSSPAGASSALPAETPATPVVTDTVGPDTTGTDTYTPEPTDSPAGEVTVEVPATVTNADEIGATFSTYYSGINSGNYQTAYSQLGPDVTTGMTLDEFSAQERSSQVSNVEVEDAQPGPQDGAVLVDLDFTSNQDVSQSPDASSCDQWALEYTVVRNSSGYWVIDKAEGRDGPGYTPC